MHAKEALKHRFGHIGSEILFKCHHRAPRLSVATPLNLMIRDFDFEHFLGTPGLHVTGVTSPLLERP